MPGRVQGGVKQRKCRKCGKWVVLTRFRKANNCVGGFASTCQKCQNGYNQQIYEFWKKRIRKQALRDAVALLAGHPGAQAVLKQRLGEL